MLSSATRSAADRPPPPRAGDWVLSRRPHGWCGRFAAMASPCEVHVTGVDRRAAEHLVDTVAGEARRIECKYSRYRRGNIVDRINSADGEAVRVDAETARLLDYAAELFRLSQGRFDITSGVLRRAWRFDGGDAVPDAAEVARLMTHVGWDKVRWKRPRLELRPGMQIDLGGIGKEYAVDRAAALVRGTTESCLVNFGGDLLALGPPGCDALRPRPGPRPSRGWTVGVDGVMGAAAPLRRIELGHGALATSGDARRYVLRDGRRYGHVLDARTGWPVEGAPRSVTVAAPTCTEAGMLATFAMLMGADAEPFLDAQRVKHWCLR